MVLLCFYTVLVAVAGVGPRPIPGAGYVGGPNAALATRQIGRAALWNGAPKSGCPLPRTIFVPFDPSQAKMNRAQHAPVRLRD